MTLDELAWGTDGLVGVTIVDARDGAILTSAFANREAVESTMRTGATHLWSRSRQALWRKGETSGNTQRVVAIDVDCDGDALIYRVVPSGPACHTGNDSCFYRNLWTADDATVKAGSADFERAVRHLVKTIDERRGASPETSYVAKMLARGVDGIGKKIGEEATEVVIAAKNDDRGELIWEAADLLFHTLVMLAQRNVDIDEVGRELLRRAAR
jgi:phosphoribosyl-AMP cyclohydrolase / phosphoribosyl-ATP pyrophosphohydrolase